MTNEQIIINDIDVSKCEYYDKNKPLLTCVCEEYPCSECPNCYYKQLKRSEAQCEGMFVSHTDLEKKYKAKEQECEELKNAVMQECPQCGEIYLNPVGCELYEENQQLKAKNKIQKETIDGFLTVLSILGKNNIKLRETLAEIKEIIEQGVKIHDDIIVSKKVLQIIDEVENGHTKED